MTITHLATSLNGGAGIGAWRYHQALIAAGVNSRVLVIQAETEGEATVSKVQWLKYPLPLRLAHRLGWALPNPALFQKQIADLNNSVGNVSYELFTVPFSDYCPEDHPWVRQADVINIHWVAGLLDWPRFFHRVRKPIVFTLHDQQPYLGGVHYSQDLVNNSHLSALEILFTRVKQNAIRSHRIAVAANSRWNADAALDCGFYPPGTPIETIYYPLDTDVFTPQPKQAAKAAVGIIAGCRVVGFACENLNNHRKGFTDLLAAIALLPESVRAAITLLSFGRDPSPELRQRITLPWVHLGFLKTDVEKVAAYAAMDVFVCPSRAEAFGLTALEAGAVGIPVVATSVGGLCEAVPVAVAPNPEAIRDEIVALLTDDTLHARRAEAGRRLAVERHNPARIGAQLATFLERLVG